MGSKKQSGVLLVIILMIILGLLAILNHNDNKSPLNPSQRLVPCSNISQPQSYFNHDTFLTDYQGGMIINSTEGGKIVISKDFYLKMTESGSCSMGNVLPDNSIIIFKKVLTRNEINVGDIVDIQGDIVHRLIRITDECYTTKGDNMFSEDMFCWKFSDIEGRMVGVLY